MKKISIEVEAYKFEELILDPHRESMKEMRRLYGQDTLEVLASNIIVDSEKYCQSILNTQIVVDITVQNFSRFPDVQVFITSVMAGPVSKDAAHNSCLHIQEAVNIIGDIKLFSKVLNKLKFNDEHHPAQVEMEDLVNIRTRELTYELVQSITGKCAKEIDAVHTDEWAESMAVQGGILFTKEGKVIEGILDYDQHCNIQNMNYLDK